MIEGLCTDGNRYGVGADGVLTMRRQDGKPLAQGDGPWRLVVPSEARPTRWAKQVVRLVVSNAQ